MEKLCVGQMRAFDEDAMLGYRVEALDADTVVVTVVCRRQDALALGVFQRYFERHPDRQVQTMSIDDPRLRVPVS